MDSYLAFMNEIHILYVDHELPLPAMNTIQLLEACQYRVTHVELAIPAMQILANGKTKFDFIIANINSPDVQAFKLIQVAVSMEIPIIMMCGTVEEDTMMAMRVIEHGAFLYIRRPTTLDMLRCLWQHVARENAREMMERERLNMAASYAAPRGVEMTQVQDENPNNVFLMKEKRKVKRSYYKGRGIEEEYDSDNPSHGRVKRKICTEWTQDLHEKFMSAVAQLGEGSCFPREILALMNVPGLTRMQVASHLQKCRNDNWRSPDDRKSTLGMQPLSSDSEGGANHKIRRFGCMPRPIKEASDLQPYCVGPETHTISAAGALNETITANQQISYHYGPLIPHPTNGLDSSNIINRNQSADDFLNLQDMGCLIQSSMPQGFGGMSHPQSGSRGFEFEPDYGHDRIFCDERKLQMYGKIEEGNLKEASLERRSQWPTSDDLEARQIETVET